MLRYYKVGDRYIRDVTGTLYEYEDSNQRDADYGSLDKRGPRNHTRAIPYVGMASGGPVKGLLNM